MIFGMSQHLFSVFPIFMLTAFTAFALKDVFGISLGKRLFDLHIVSSEK